ncbi:MAG: hypothetical protein ACKO91_17395 [Acidimicrobiales bacterium]
MTMMGANPDELDRLGATLRRQIPQLDAVIGAAGTALDATPWTGPARDRFVEAWQSQFVPALRRLGEAFEAAGADCAQRAAALRQVMGAG